MKLHQDRALFAELIHRASRPVDQGGLGINAAFIEKDYWITRSLYLLSKSASSTCAVFKGGTSLSKIFHIGSRFSEDIDIAIIRNENMSDAGLKTMIRNTEKAMSDGLTHILKPGITSKGSRYRKTFYIYAQIPGLMPIGSVLSGQLLIEINSFANPFPYSQQKVSCFLKDYLLIMGYSDIIDEYDFADFAINTLDKRTTMTEKIISLIRFSLAKDPIPELLAKIRHFYDLYYLMQDTDCIEYVNSSNSRMNLTSLIEHDKSLFEKPDGWRIRSFSDSPLFSDWHSLWRELSPRYKSELPTLAYQAIPAIDDVQTSLGDLFVKVSMQLGLDN